MRSCKAAKGENIRQPGTTQQRGCAGCVEAIGRHKQHVQRETAVGSIKDIDSTDTLKAIAAAYLSAFTQDAKTYPYLVG